MNNWGKRHFLEGEQGHSGLAELVAAGVCGKPAEGQEGVPGFGVVYGMLRAQEPSGGPSPWQASPFL